MGGLGADPLQVCVSSPHVLLDAGNHGRVSFSLLQVKMEFRGVGI